MKKPRKKESRDKIEREILRELPYAPLWAIKLSRHIASLPPEKLPEDFMERLKGLLEKAG